MTLRPEGEINALRQHIEALRLAPWIGPARQWWPAYLFHCTDVLNVVNILRQGEILSRTQVAATGQLQRDIASPEVIEHTAPQWQDYVRLYFRPRTPTQYRNEGFRPQARLELGSHCPVPVYLIFDALSVLSRADSLFTDGNLGAAGATPKGEVESLKQIPFEQVYHVGPFNSAFPNSIVYHRNAEVLAPKQMSLDSLRHISCRSGAEYETLLHLLPPGTRSRWAARIGVRSDLNLFNREWTFVEQAEMSEGMLIFRFNRNSKGPGPFVARVALEEAETGRNYYWRSEDYRCDKELTLALTSMQNPADYTVRFFLDDQLAYANRYQRDDLPF